MATQKQASANSSENAANTRNKLREQQARTHVRYFEILRERYEDGDNLSAFKVVYLSIANGQDLPAWAKAYLLKSASNFFHAKVASLGEAFGIQDILHHKAVHDWRMASMIALEVRRLNSSGIPLKNNKKGPGAFAMVSDMYKSQMWDLSPSKVRDMYEDWKDAMSQKDD